MIMNGQFARHLNQFVVTCHDIFRDMRIEPEKTSESPLESGNNFLFHDSTAAVGCVLPHLLRFRGHTQTEQIRYHSSKRGIGSKTETST